MLPTKSVHEALNLPAPQTLPKWRARLLAISNGLALLWELTGPAFRWFIDQTLWREIRDSQLLRQSLGFGLLVSITMFLYGLEHCFSWLMLVFLSYQALRLLHFLGMERDPIKLIPDSNSTINRRQVRVGEEEEDD